MGKGKGIVSISMARNGAVNTVPLTSYDESVLDVVNGNATQSLGDAVHLMDTMMCSIIQERDSASCGDESQSHGDSFNTSG